MMKHNDFRKSGVVSVWLGNFNSDIELDEYLNLSRKFEDDLRFEFNERDMPETVVKSEPVPIAQLVDGFSWGESYATSVVEQARQNGIEFATTMVVFLNFEYLPELAKPKIPAALQFIGASRFS